MVPPFEIGNCDDVSDKGFGWQGHLAGVSGIFDGKHLFLLSEQEMEGKTGTKLVNREEFGGLLYTPLMRWLGMGEKTKKGFVAFNEPLKKKAEETA